MSAQLPTIRLTYGTLEVRGFYRMDLGGWGRRETYKGDDGEVSYEMTHALNGEDMTPPKKTYPTGYDSRCGWCYLNAPHTEAAHDDSVRGRK